MAKKIRLDELVVQQSLAPNQDMARRLIMAGEIRTGDRVWDKSGDKVPIETLLELKSRRCRWVSKGGLKLEKALKDFKIKPKGYKCIDIGASTGGFTDVLLHSGAEKVVAVDVGYGLLDAKIQKDPRVEIHDRTNFRLAPESLFGGPFDLAVTDVSFISLRMILPKAMAILKEYGLIVALIKPQFEAEKAQVPKGGVIGDLATHVEVISRLFEDMQQLSIYLHNISAIPRVDKKKNIEFLSMWNKSPSKVDNTFIVKKVRQAHALQP